MSFWSCNLKRSHECHGSYIYMLNVIYWAPIYKYTLGKRCMLCVCVCVSVSNGQNANKLCSLITTTTNIYYFGSFIFLCHLVSSHLVLSSSSFFAFFLCLSFYFCKAHICDRGSCLHVCLTMILVPSVNCSLWN